MKILVVDDERNIRESIARYLSLEGIEAVGAENGLSAKRLLQEQVFAAGIIDLRMPGLDGLQLLEWIREQGPRLPVIMISAHGEIEDAVQAMKLGAEDYVVKPFDPEELVLRVKKLLDTERLRERVELASRRELSDLEALGAAPCMVELRRTIEKVADTPSTVLISGESGTGKEVIARLIHRLSSRAERPFVAVNIGALPETLLESELFGHEKGAFTGAERRKPGMFELASGGTLFLDEIGEMPLHLQVKLLRVLQERRLQHLGGTESIPIDARIMAATNRDLSAAVREGRFRDDLYYRLNVIHLQVPPLRERSQDIALIAGQLLVSLNARLGRSVKSIEPEGIRRLQAYAFPGNVRELENLMERALIFAEGQTLRAADLALPLDQAAARASPPPASSLEGMERAAIAAALQRWEGNRTRAAAELGINRRTLLNKIKQYGIEG